MSRWSRLANRELQRLSAGRKTTSREKSPARNQRGVLAMRPTHVPRKQSSRILEAHCVTERVIHRTHISSSVQMTAPSKPVC